MNDLRIMVVCGFGLGSSLILKIKLDNVLRRHNLAATTFCADVTTANGERYDILFTSRELASHFQPNSRPVVVISNFLSEQEIAEKGVPVIEQVYALRAAHIRA